MKILCTICARKGSKGLKNKNMKILAHKPLINHTIDLALSIKSFSTIVITSDYQKLKKLEKKYNKILFHLRPNRLCGDKVGKLDVIKDAVLAAETKTGILFDIIIDLDITSPIRTIKDIKNCLNYFMKEKFDNLVTATKSKKNPYFNMLEYKNNRLIICKKIFKKKKLILRRQDAPETYTMNASIYIWKRKVLFSNKNLINRKTGLYLMSDISSFDIDTFLEFKINQLIINNEKIFKKN